MKRPAFLYFHFITSFPCIIRFSIIWCTWIIYYCCSEHLAHSCGPGEQEVATGIFNSLVVVFGLNTVLQPVLSSQPAFLLRAHAADTNFKIMHTLVCSYMTSAQLLARATYIVLFDLKPLKQRRQLAGRYVLYACAKRNLRSPQNTLQSM